MLSPRWNQAAFAVFAGLAMAFQAAHAHASCSYDLNGVGYGDDCTNRPPNRPQPVYTRPQPSYTAPAPSAPAGPTPEEIRQAEEARVAAEAAQKKAAFIQDRDSTSLRGEGGGRMTDAIRDVPASGDGIRTGTSSALDALKDMSGSGDDAVQAGGNLGRAREKAGCGFSGGLCGHVPSVLGVPTPRTAELLSHIPDDKREDPAILKLLQGFQDADRERRRDVAALAKVRKKMAGGSGDAPALTKQSDALKTGILRTAGTETKVKNALRENLGAAWDETPGPAAMAP